MPLRRIVSGGQTGVDRAALQVAIDLGVAHGGWCPRGRRAEDGVIPDCFQLSEVESPDYAVRTVRNVEDSDGTLILHAGPLTGGTALTALAARRAGKPLLLVDLSTPADYDPVRSWIQSQGVATLNVAGPRESTCPGIHAKAVEFLRGCLSTWQSPLPPGEP